MTGEEQASLAKAIAAELRGHVMPAVLPLRIGVMIRKTGRGFTWMHNLPLGGPDSIGLRYTLMANGSMHIEMMDSYGERFWEGTLISEQ